MTNIELAKRILTLVKEETRLTLEVIHLLREVEVRKLYLEMSYGSLFDFARKFLDYSEGAAMRRIQAMRLLRSVPEAEADIRAGNLTLSTAAQVENFSRKNGIDRRVAIDRVKGKGARDAERALLELAPQAIPEERVRVVSNEHTEIRIVLNAELIAKADQLKTLLSHTNPDMSYADLFGRAVDFMLARVDPARRKTRTKRADAPTQPKKVISTDEVNRHHACKDKVYSHEAYTDEPLATKSKYSTSNSERSATPTSESQRENSPPTSTCGTSTKVNPDNGYVPSALNTYIWRRDQSQCIFMDDFGRRCESKHLLEVDHIYPWAMGGQTSAENLRLLCRAHNQFLAAKFFGDEKMRRMREERH